MSHWENDGKSNNWYTPKYVFDALDTHFDLDVAGKEIEISSVPADEIIDHSSLDKPWNGYVWMNPPFGSRNGLDPWLDKFFSHGNGIALTPDRTSAPWFMKNWLRADLVMFTPKIKFIREDGSLGTSPSNGTTLWACGDEAYSALKRAARSGLGILAEPRAAKGGTN